MSGSTSTVGRSGKIWLAVVMSFAMTASVLASTVIGLEAAGADSAPIAPNTIKTVTADSLPTAQMNGVAWDQVIVGNTVYVTGEFTKARPAGAAAGVNETTRTNLLAYNLTTGALITTWAPSINAQGKAIAASADGTKIYVVGSFTQANGVSRNRIAAFDATSGALITTFNPNANYTVNDVAVSGSTVYFSGDFTAVTNQTRTRMAAVDGVTGALRPWAPTADLTVRTLVAPAGSNKIIVGGHFTLLNGEDIKGMGALDATTGAVLPWPVNQIVVNWGVDAAVWSLTTNGSSVFGVGYTYLVNGVNSGNFEGTFAADVATGELQWITGCRGDHYDVTVAADVVYDVSHTHDCASNGGNPQTEPWTFQYATAWTASPEPGATNNGGYFGGRPSPKLLHWQPTLVPGTYTGKTQAAWTIESNSQYVVMGGEFPRVNGAAQYGLARFAVTQVAPNTSGPQNAGDMNPSLVGISPGTLRVAWTSAWDRDNEQLTYEVLRGNTLDSSVVVKTITANSNWYTRPKLSFTDTTAPAGSTQTYRIRVKDPFGNTAVGLTVTGTVPSGQATDSAYRTAVKADNPVSYWRLGESSGTLGYDQIGADDLTVEASAQRGQVGALTNETGELSTTFDGNGTVPASTTGTATPGSQDFSAEVWFKTTTTRGGKILGFGRSSTGNSGSYDRHLYMQNNGALRFGVYDGSTRTVVSSAGLNDGQWHHAVGEMGPAGLKLYVDGKLVGSDVTATVAENYPGYWRIGGDNIGGWPGQPTSSSFAGSIDEVAIYSGQLSQDQVRGHWLASGRSANWPIPPAAPADTYGAAVWADNPNLFLRLDETSGSDAVDRTTNLTGANYFDGVTKAQAPSPAAAAGTSVSLDSGAARVVATDSTNNPQVFSQEVWFKTTTTNGGRIIGFGNSQNGQSNNYDRAAYMLNSGQIRYGVWTGQESTVVSPLAYNDGAWHHLVVTQNVGEQKMYVDGDLVVQGTFGAPQDYTGYWRLGSDSMWGGANTQDFRGQLDEAAIYPTVLSAGRVLAHWTAAGGLAPNVSPTAAFSSSHSFLTANVDASASSDPDGSITSYAWDFGDGATGIGVTASHTYSAAGTYNVTLTVTDNRGGTAVIAHPVTVVANVAPTASFTSSVTNLAASFNGTGSSDTDGTIAGYAWNFGDGATATGATTNHTYATPGTWTVTLTVTDDQGATNVSTSQVTTTAAPPANVAPTASFTSSTSGLTATVDGTGSTDTDGSIVSYAWNFGDGATAVGSTASHTYGTGGTYTVSLKVTDNQGATHTTTNTVTVTAPNVAPTAAFTSSTSGLSATVDASTSSDIDGSIAGYAWDFGDGATASGVTASHTYLLGGTYTVTLTVTDNDGATNVTTRTVAVTAPPANVAPTAAFTSSTSNLLASFNGSGSSDSDGSIVGYAWNFGDTSTGTGATTSHAYAAAGTYTVTLTVTDNQGATNSVSHPVTVTAPPANVAPTAVFSSSTANLVASFNGSGSSDSDGSIVGYAWNFGDTSTGTGATTSHAYAAAGTYTVTLTVTDNQGATNSVSQSVTVSAPPVGANFVQDLFGRSVSNNWGSADVGGAWTVSGGNTGFSVSGGAGRIQVAAGVSRSATLDSVLRSSTEVNTTLSLDKAQTGGGTYLAVIGRKVNATNDYRLKLQAKANGQVAAQLIRNVGGIEAVVQSVSAVPGLTYNAGDVLRVKFQVDGTGTTALAAKVWKDGTSEPAGWNLQATDTTAALQAAGSVGVWMYLSGTSTATSTPMTLSVDDFTAAPIG